MPAEEFLGGRVAFKNAVDVYELLERNATLINSTELQEYGYPVKDFSDQTLVFRGYATILAREELRLLDSAVSHATALLKAMNSVTLLIPGNKFKPSIYLLHYKPTPEQYQEFTGRTMALGRRVAPTVYDGVVNDIERLKQRLTTIEAILTKLLEHTHGGNNA